METDHQQVCQNNKIHGVRDGDEEFKSELLPGEGVGRGTVIRDNQTPVQVTTAIKPFQANGGTPTPYDSQQPQPRYGLKPSLPDRSIGVRTPELLAGRFNVDSTRNLEGIKQEYDSCLNHHNGIDGDEGYRGVHSGNHDCYDSGNDSRPHSPSTHIPKEGGQGGQRNRRISIEDLITGHSHIRQPHLSSNTSTPSSISPATPEDHPSPYLYLQQPASIHSPVPVRQRPSFAGSRPGSSGSLTSLGSPSLASATARPSPYSYNRRPGPIHAPSSLTTRQRASPYPPTSAARYDGVGLGINMINTPSTSGNSPLGNVSPGAGAGNESPALQSPGSMAGRRKAPEWPEAKSTRSHSFNSANATTPRDMYQTLKTPAALRVPTTAQLLSPAYRPGMESPMPIAGSSGVGPIRRGIPGSAPPLSASRVDSAIPPTPRRVHLLDVPRAKVISTLNERAEKYWFDPSTSDCRIYVPIPRKKAGPPPSPQGTGDSGPRRRNWPPVPDVPSRVEGITGEERNIVNTHHYYKSRRGSCPTEEEVPVLVFHIHRDYLVTQSNLLRSLLTATSPTRPAFPQSPITPQSRSFPTPILRMPKERTLRGSRVMPQRDGEPVSVYMPIPDPASFGIVLHWLYWGDIPTLERALSHGLATWQGVVKNIEYLGLDDSIKRVIGKWWRTWVKTDVGRQSTTAGAGIDRRPSASDTEAITKGKLGRKGQSRTREFSVSSESATDDEQEEDGMEVDLNDGVGLVKEEDDGGVGDLLKNL